MAAVIEHGKGQAQAARAASGRAAAPGGGGLALGRSASVTAGLILLGVVAANTISSQLILSILISVVSFALLAVSVGFLLKQNGWITFGHAAYFGAGAYFVTLGFARGLPAELVIIGAIAASAAIAFVTGLIIGRVSGVALGMLTLAVGQTFFEVATRSRAVGGSDGMAVRIPDSIFGLPSDLFYHRGSMFIIGWVLLLVILFLLSILGRSRFGQLAEAIRENEERVRFLGYRTLIPRAIIYAVSAAVAAVAGIYTIIYSGFVSPETLELKLSGAALIMALLGGASRLWGPVVGAVVYVALRDVVGALTDNWQAIVGISLIVVIIAMPDGITGLLGERFGRRFTKGASKREEGGHGHP